jgi:cob(I)alamin adenosyltransferase
MVNRLREVQRELFGVAGELADPSGQYKAGFTDETVKKLEQWIDEAVLLYDPAPKFIVPGSNKGSGAMHIARTVCRRAERLIVALNDRSPIDPLLVKYVNRLSDLLYTYARYAEECQETV